MKSTTMTHATAKQAAEFLFAAALSIPSALHADTAYLLADGSGNAAAVNTASHWDPAIAPADADGADTDFVVQDGRTFRTGDSATSFPGKSLQLGASDFSTAGSVADAKPGYYYIKDLRLYKGSYGYTNNKWLQVVGSATVYSPASAPFAFNSRGNDNGYMNMKLTGDETVAVKLTTWQGTAQGADTKPFFVQADQSQTYSGSWIIGQGVYFYPFPSSSNGGGNNTTSAMQFGKPLATLNPRALVMGKNSSIRYEVGDPRTFAASDNRGLWLDAGGYNVTYMLTNNKKHNFGWPIGGAGTFLVSGPGTFNLRAECAVLLRIKDATPKLVLCPGASITSAGGLVLPNNYLVSLETSATDVTVNNLVATNANFKFPVSSDGSVCAKLRLAGDLSGLSGRVGLALTAIPTVAAETDIPVITIDSSVTRTFTPDDFSPWSITGAQCPTAKGVKVERDAATGDQVVSITVLPYVRTTYTQQSGWAYFESWAWNSVTPSLGDGRTYVAWNINVGNRNESDDLTIPCDRLVLYNPTSAGYYMYLRNARTTFAHLLALDDAALWAYSYYTGNYPTKGQPHEVAGTLEVETTTGHAFSLIAARSQIKVTATVSGDGTIRARSTATSYTPPCMVELTAENTGYRGAFHAYNPIDCVENTCILKISSEANLGGNPRIFAADAFKLGYACIFTPTAAVTINDANRGVTFSASTNTASEVRTGPTFALAEGCDFTVETPVVIESGTFTKTGAGTLAWGAGGTTVSSGAALDIQAGAVKPLGFDAFGDMALSFASGTALADDIPLESGDGSTAYGVDLRTATVFHADSKLFVRLDAGTSFLSSHVSRVSVPVATFATEAAATAFLADVSVTAPHGYDVEPFVNAQTLGGSTVYVAGLKLFKKGLILILR